MVQASTKHIRFFKPRFLLGLVFVVFLLHPQETKACELTNISPSSDEVVDVVQLCNDITQELEEQGVLRQGEIALVDLVLEVIFSGRGFQRVYIQVWDGTYLRFEGVARVGLSTGRSWVELEE